MQTLKQEVLEKISELPEDATFDDMMYKMYLISKIKSGQQDIKEGRYYSHEEVLKESEKW